MKIVIDKKILSQNKRDRMHWSKRSKDKNEWGLCIMASVNGIKKYKAEGKKTVRITSFRKRLLDLPNLWGGMKDLIDSLVVLGLLVDDSPKWADFHIEQRQEKPERTEIEIV